MDNLYMQFLLLNIEANRQAASNSPEHANWSNGVAEGLKLALDGYKESLKREDDHAR
jgi:hypothetical protein